jgi:hypothetical protein
MSRATWIGYSLPEPHLPKIKTNKLTCFGLHVGAMHPFNQEAMHQLNVQYAKNYDCWQDVVLIVKNYRHLGG